MSVTYYMLQRQLGRFETVRRIAAHRIAEAVGLPKGRLPILEYVRGHPGASQREIADAMHISPASVAVTIRRMERDGLLWREGDDSDQRINRIHATDAGIDAARRSREAFDALDARMFAGFTQAELQALHDTLERLYANLAGDEYDAIDLSCPPMLEPEPFHHIQQEEDDA